MRHTLLFTALIICILSLSGCGSDQMTIETKVIEHQAVIATGIIASPIETMTGSLPETFTGGDILAHATESDCRTIIHGIIYDVTAYFGKHPGGDRNLLRICGTDATQVFQRQHGSSQKVNNILSGFEIGVSNR